MSQLAFRGSPHSQPPGPVTPPPSSALSGARSPSPQHSLERAPQPPLHPHAQHAQHPLLGLSAGLSMAVTTITGPPPARSAASPPDSAHSAHSASSRCYDSGAASPPESAGRTAEGLAPGSVPGLRPPPPGGPAGPGGRCCDTGRPIFTDPITGQTVCSCQYDLLSYQRLASAGAGLPLSMYSSPYPEGMAAYFPALGADQPPFYSSPAGLDLKDNLPPGAGAWPYPSVYHPYDAAFAGYPFNGYGMDLNGARRKNATRETTSTLKAWLSEHKKNPYPTKGEKIMLAIITKMTLTQVSTWFANARRRLKKENKMTWEPKNKTDDDEDAIVSDSDDNCTGSQRDKDEQMLLHQRDADKEHREQRDKDGLHMVKSEQSKLDLDEEDDDLDDLDERKYHMQHAYHHPLQGMPHGLMLKDEPGVPLPATKPKIWSLADTAACKTPPPPPPGSSQPWPSSCAGPGGGPAGGMGGMGMNGFALPSASMSPSAAAPAPYSRYGGGGGGGGGGFFGGGSYSGGGHPGAGALGGGACAGQGFPDVQTDTPPQTPPNMKLPSVAGSLNCFQGNQNPNLQQGPHQGPPQGGAYQQQQQQPQQHYMQTTSPNNYNRLQHPQQQQQQHPHQMQQQQQHPHMQQMQQQPPQMQEMSPVKERSPMHSGDEGTVSPYLQHPQQQHGMQQQHHMMNGNAGATPSPNESTAFKPFYKSSPTMGGGFVSPV